MKSDSHLPLVGVAELLPLPPDIYPQPLASVRECVGTVRDACRPNYFETVTNGPASCGPSGPRGLAQLGIGRPS